MNRRGMGMVTLIVLICSILGVILAGVTLAIQMHEGKTDPPAITDEPEDCTELYDLQCLPAYEICISNFKHIRAAGIECEGAGYLQPVAHCIVSEGYDQQIYNSPGTSDRPKYFTQSQLDACRRVTT